MDEKFSAEELDIAKELINIGLGKAADSMAFFTKNKVFIKSVDLRLDDNFSFSNFYQKDQDDLLYILSTELKGDLQGVCYLVFSEQEVNEILKIALPPTILEDKSKLEMMSEAILLEMDNIIVASVITQFSNFFNYQMHGDVPHLSKTVANGFSQIMESANNTATYILYFKSVFNTVGLDIQPDFIWLMDEKYIKGVKNVAQNSQLLEKMRVV